MKRKLRCQLKHAISQTAFIIVELIIGISLIINPIGLSFIPSFTKLNRHYAFTLVNCNHGKVAIIHTACTTRIIYTQNYTYPISTLVYENPYTNIFKLEL